MGDSCFDCSGLTKAAYNAAGINLPRTAQTQYNAGPLVPAGQPLLPDDLVFYGTPDNVHHVGLYVGAGKMVHAPTFGRSRSATTAGTVPITSRLRAQLSTRGVGSHVR